MTIRVLACVGVVAAVLAVAAQGADKPEDLAQHAAESWLMSIDAGNAEASWDQAAKLFKGFVTKSQWTQVLAGMRPPLGKLISRKVMSRQYQREVVGGTRWQVRDHPVPISVREESLRC